MRPNSGTGILVFVIAMVLITVAAVGLSTVVSEAKTPGNITPASGYERINAKEGGDWLSSTNLLVVAADASGYLGELDTPYAEVIHFLYSISAVGGSNSQKIYLQGYYCEGWHNLTTYNYPAVVVSALGSAQNTLQTTDAFTAIGDRAVSFRGFPRCGKYRIHLDADATHACTMDNAEFIIEYGIANR